MPARANDNSSIRGGARTVRLTYPAGSSDKFVADGRYRCMAVCAVFPETVKLKGDPIGQFHDFFGLLRRKYDVMGANLTSMAISITRSEIPSPDEVSDGAIEKSEFQVNCGVALRTQYPSVGETAFHDFVEFHEAIRKEHPEFVSPLRTDSGDTEISLLEFLDSSAHPPNDTQN